MALLWSGVDAASEPPAAAGAMLETIVDRIPDEDAPGWTRERPIVANAMAAVAYALRAYLHDDYQAAVWAARQLVEAADFVVEEDPAEPLAVDVAAARATAGADGVR
jgi:hypothetical protein